MRRRGTRAVPGRGRAPGLSASELLQLGGGLLVATPYVAYFVIRILVVRVFVEVVGANLRKLRHAAGACACLR